MEDFRLQAITRVEGASIIRERSIIPTLLSGCGSLIGIWKKIYERVDEIQREYLRIIYCCAPSTPNTAFISKAKSLLRKSVYWLRSWTTRRFYFVGDYVIKNMSNFKRNQSLFVWSFLCLTYFFLYFYCHLLSECDDGT